MQITTFFNICLSCWGCELLNMFVAVVAFVYCLGIFFISISLYFLSWAFGWTTFDLYRTSYICLHLSTRAGVFFLHFSNKNVFLLDFWRFPLSWAFMDNLQPLSVLAAKEFLLNFILSSSFFLFFLPVQFQRWWWWCLAFLYRIPRTYISFISYMMIWLYMMRRRSRRVQGLAFSYKIPRTYILMWTNPLGANPDKTLEYILYLILD